MSSAYYPLGLRVNNYPNSYISWKSPNNYATISRNIKPFTNNDPSYTDPGAFGKPRPIKQYRKGILINNENKLTKSSNGMPHLLETIQDTPAMVHGTTTQDITNNPIISNQCNTPDQCNTSNQCSGIPIICLNNKIYNTTDTPTYNSKEFCCNKEKNALSRVIYANTGYIPPTYYPSYSQYINGRGNTYKQNIFDFENISNPELNTYVIPNVYNLPNCPKLAVYKPSNPQFAIQNAVSNGTRILKLSTTTIERGTLLYKNKSYPVTCNYKKCNKLL